MLFIDLACSKASGLSRHTETRSRPNLQAGGRLARASLARKHATACCPWCCPMSLKFSDLQRCSIPGAPTYRPLPIPLATVWQRLVAHVDVCGESRSRRDAASMRFSTPHDEPRPTSGRVVVPVAWVRVASATPSRPRDLRAEESQEFRRGHAPPRGYVPSTRRVSA
jgi:hypothetical protein